MCEKSKQDLQSQTSDQTPNGGKSGTNFSKTTEPTTTGPFKEMQYVVVLSPIQFMTLKRVFVELFQEGQHRQSAMEMLERFCQSEVSYKKALASMG